MFSMPENNESLASKEGLSDDHPILLHAPFTVTKFDNLLT